MPALNQRLIRRTAMLAKKETTYATDAAPAPAQGIPFYDADFEVDIAQVSRDLVRQFMGAADVLAGRELAKIKITHELQNGGTAGTAPAWDDIFQTLGFAGATLATPARYEYTPISSGFASCTMYCYGDGVLYKALGCISTATLDMTVGKAPTVSYDIQGLYGGESAATITLPALNSWKTPNVIKKSSVVDLTLGCTYATGALTGGTTYSTRGLTIDIGNDVQYIEMASGDYVTITNRKVTGKVVMDLAAADEVSQMALVRSSTTQKLGFTVGTAAGAKFLVYGPAVQLSNPTIQNVQGIRMIQFDLTFQPSATGNDELRLVLL